MPDVVAASAVVLLVVVMLAPAVARLQRTSAEARCQSNLHMWSKAMALYQVDNCACNPTNMLSGGVPVAMIPLTRDGLTNPDGTPKRFYYGLNWVEGLYPYVQSVAGKAAEDWIALRACPNAGSSVPRSAGSPSTAYMTYALNSNLVAYLGQLPRTPNKLMMLREVQYHVNSILRPSNASTNGTTVPANCFANGYDSLITPFLPTTGKIHGNGSYIAFADGHVAYFPLDYYPQTPEYDSTEQRWYNYVTLGTPATQKTIAITP